MKYVFTGEEIGKALLVALRDRKIPIPNPKEFMVHQYWYIDEKEIHVEFVPTKKEAALPP